MAPFDIYTTSYWSAILSILYHFRVIWRWRMLWLWGPLKVIRNDSTRYIAYVFLFVFHCNYGHSLYVSEIKRDVVRKSWFFSYPFYITTPMEKRLRIFSYFFHNQPDRWHGRCTRCQQILQKVSCVALLTHSSHALQTDGHADGQTEMRSQ